MIAKGNLHAHGTKLAAYMVSGKKGEHAELLELRGFAATSIGDAFIDVQIQAAGTRAVKPFFHAYVRLPDGEGIAPEQWRLIADRLEQRLGFDEQPRAVAFHHGPDGTHMHVTWSRIDLETMKAIDPGLYKNKLKQACRELEQELGLTQVTNDRAPHDTTQAPGRDEFEEARRLGTDLKAVRAGIRECWDSADSGKAFAAALEERGLMLAKGDRRDFVVVDAAGGQHALNKKLTGATAAATRQRLADLAGAPLPTVAAAQGQQLEQARQREQAMADRKADEQRKAAEADEQRRLDAAKQAEERQRQAIEAEEQRKEQARREEEQRREAAQKEEETKRQTLTEEERRREQLRQDGARQAQQNADRQLEQTAEMKSAYEREQQRLHVYARQLDEQASQAKKWLEQQQTLEQEQRGTRDAGARYAQALGDHYDVRDPYGSLSRAAMAEHAAFRRDREQLSRQIDAEADPAKRDRLETRQKIELADYMAITGDRIANQSEVIVGRSNTDEALRQRARAALFREEAKELRQQLRPAHEQTKDKPAAQAPDRPMTAAEFAINPAARRQHQQAQADQRSRDKEREEALDRIDKNLAGGRTIHSEDLRKLRRAELEQIQKAGSEGLRDVLERHREERGRTNAAAPDACRQRERDRDRD